MTDEETKETSEAHCLPIWRQAEIAKKVCGIFMGTLQNGSENVLQCAMESLGIIPIPYSEISKKMEDIGQVLGEYGFIFPPVNGIRMFFFNQKQGCLELRKTSWHEVGHVELGHRQGSRLAEAEADFFMECAMLLEANIEKLKEVMPMICETKSA